MNSKLKETMGPRFSYRSKLEKACIQHDMAYTRYQGLAVRTTPDKVLHDKAFEVANVSQYYGYHWGPTLTVYTFFDKKLVWSGADIAAITSNHQLADLITQTSY